MTEFEGRLEAARSRMHESGADCLLLSVGSDLPYLTGYTAMPLERLTMFVLTESAATLVVPELEVPRVETGPFEIHTWRETDHPIDIVTTLAGRPTIAAIGDQTWALFLIQLLARMSGTTFIPASSVTSELRIRKGPEEIAHLARAGAAVDRVLARIPSEVSFAGRTEREVANDVVKMTIAEGHELAQFWIVASGPNSASPHHEPGDRIMAHGDVVVIDFGGKLNGYCSDVSRTFSIGPPSAKAIEVHEIVRAAQAAGREAATPGTPCQEVDRACRKVISDAGFGEYFIHRTGHGIGLDGHEEPYIIEGNDRLIEPGMAFSIEPGIYLPGEFGVRIEDICVATADGVDVLNNADRSLVEVG